METFSNHFVLVFIDVMISYELFKLCNSNICIYIWASVRFVFSVVVAVNKYVLCWFVLIPFKYCDFKLNWSFSHCFCNNNNKYNNKKKTKTSVAVFLIYIVKSFRVTKQFVFPFFLCFFDRRRRRRRLSCFLDSDILIFDQFLKCLWSIWIYAILGNNLLCINSFEYEIQLNKVEHENVYWCVDDTIIVVT